MSELEKALKAYDGKAVSILSEVRARLGAADVFLLELSEFISCHEGFVADGATWLIKHSAEDGVEIGPRETAAIIERLSTVRSWQAVLHLCQIAKFLRFSPDQARTFAHWASHYLDHKRPFLRAWSMDAIQHAALSASDLSDLAESALAQATRDTAASVRARSRKHQK